MRGMEGGVRQPQPRPTLRLSTCVKVCEFISVNRTGSSGLCGGKGRRARLEDEVLRGVGMASVEALSVLLTVKDARTGAGHV